MKSSQVMNLMATRLNQRETIDHQKGVVLNLSPKEIAQEEKSNFEARKKHRGNQEQSLTLVQKWKSSAALDGMF